MTVWKTNVFLFAWNEWRFHRLKCRHIAQMAKTGHLCCEFLLNFNYRKLIGNFRTNKGNSVVSVQTLNNMSIVNMANEYVLDLYMILFAKISTTWNYYWIHTGTIWISHSESDDRKRFTTEQKSLAHVCLDSLIHHVWYSVDWFILLLRSRYTTSGANKTA